MKAGPYIRGMHQSEIDFADQCIRDAEDIERRAFALRQDAEARRNVARRWAAGTDLEPR
jgi:hypothetical protein